MSHFINKVYSPDTSKLIDEQKQGTAYQSENGQATTPSKLAFIETYGCQMNFSDTEIIASVLTKEGYGFTADEKLADLVLLNTCSIRENAETKIWHRLKSLKAAKKQNPDLLIGVMGCMAERLKGKFLEEEKLVDIVVGPDAYRDLPSLIAAAEDGQKAVNVLLSREETYADLSPVRLHSNGVSAFISIMRGCDNMCTFCVVPFTRGRERSRDTDSILKEARELFELGYREVTLLGQNVDSYKWNEISFAQLLKLTAEISPLLRIRFSTSHPKDITGEVLEVMQSHHNICKYIHLPAQSGNSRILELMHRGYTREWYMDKVSRIREVMPECGISTDIISGFCTESEEEHAETLSLMQWAGFDFAYMFAYSERPGTLAARKFQDDVPEEVKKRRLREIMEIQHRNSELSNQRDIGKTFEVLVEGESKKSASDFCGRNSQNKMIVFPRKAAVQKGDYVQVKVNSATSATLIGELV